MKYVTVGKSKKLGYDITETAAKVGIKPTSLHVYLSRLVRKPGVKEQGRRYFTNDDIATLKATFAFGTRGRHHTKTQVKVRAMAR